MDHFPIRSLPTQFTKHRSIFSTRGSTIQLLIIKHTHYYYYVHTQTELTRRHKKLKTEINHCWCIYPSFIMLEAKKKLHMNYNYIKSVSYVWSPGFRSQIADRNNCNCFYLFIIIRRNRRQVREFTTITVTVWT